MSDDGDVFLSAAGWLLKAHSFVRDLRWNLRLNVHEFFHDPFPNRNAKRGDRIAFVTFNIGIIVFLRNNGWALQDFDYGSSSLLCVLC